MAADKVALADKAGDKGRGGLVIQVVGRIPLLQVPVFQHADLITHRKGLGLIVGDQHGADASGFENIAHFGRQPAAQLAIKVGEGLIQQQQARVGRHRPGQGHALLLAAGQLMGVTSPELVEFDQRQQLIDNPLAVGRGMNTKAYILRHAQVREERIVLKYHANLALLRGNPVLRGA